MNGLRIAVAGKGGAGKTTLSSTMARLLARRGLRVLVVDGDSNPNVAVALGASREQAAQLSPLPTSLVSRRLDGPGLVEPVTTVVGRHGLEVADGATVMLMAMPAHADEGCLCSAHATVSALLADARGEQDTVVVLDLEASPEHLSRGTTRHVDILLLVVEPYFRSYETARRMAELASELPIPLVGVVANKLRRPDDADAIAEFCTRHQLTLLGQLPWSEAALDGDRAGVPLLDFAPEDPAVDGVRQLVDSLLEERVPAAL
ncbi:MAG TPA: AAA family ATPase [Acidimicrobiales bacterium]|jgi:CO dehydrogenase maturation factor|nr:AAA family ATPase [Acidimicrobiales bacterium]